MCSGWGASCARARANARGSTSWSPPAPASRSPAIAAESTLLTADLVNARRQGRELRVVSLDARARVRAAELAAAYLSLAQAHVGQSREELKEACAAVE